MWSYGRLRSLWQHTWGFSDPQSSCPSLQWTSAPGNSIPLLYLLRVIIWGNIEQKNNVSLLLPTMCDGPGSWLFITASIWLNGHAGVDSCWCCLAQCEKTKRTVVSTAAPPDYRPTLMNNWKWHVHLNSSIMNLTFVVMHLLTII